MSTKSYIDLHCYPITSLHGVGPIIAEKLAKLNIHTAQDVLFHLPSRYQDRTRLTPMGTLREGDYVVVEGNVIRRQVKLGKRRQLIILIQDASGIVELRFFHFSRAQQARMKVGDCLRCFGEIHRWRNQYNIVHPEYHYVSDTDELPMSETLTPIYPTTEGLGQAKWYDLTGQVLTLLNKGKGVIDYLSKEILQHYQLMPLTASLIYVHRPPPEASQALLVEGKHPTQRRLALEELLAYHLSLQKFRQRIQQYPAIALPTNKPLEQKFLQQLSFQLTAAQQRVFKTIAQDISQTKPMLRLVQGDVGSGKTVVAALAALRAVSHGYQVAIMVPTEILAEQHYQQFSTWFSALDIRVGWLTGSLRSKARRNVLENISLGIDQIIIGTHALFQKGVSFKQLVMVIIDEQHRFGVHQRLALHEKGRQDNLHPHQLIMTATPIPRTLTMTAYADLDVSIIDELPPGRMPINTAVVSNQRRNEVIERVQKSCQSGGQAYWVCTLIEESEVLQCQAAEVCAQQLAEQLTNLTIGLIHGRLLPVEKLAIMQRFKEGEIHLLVATTVIEVGVDVPNANLMIIENAERLGLAQLHQLRGRVGRGQQQSYCMLLYQGSLTEVAAQRLQVMRDSSDGFVIAQKDLELRGPGEILGIRQTGIQQFRVANIMRDQDLLSKIKKLAAGLQRDMPECVEPLIARWVGDDEQYANV